MQRKIFLVEKLIANMLVSTNIITAKQFVLDLSKKIAISSTGSYLLNLDIKIPRVFIQYPIHAKTKVIILLHIIQVIPIYYLNIFHSKDFFFS